MRVYLKIAGAVLLLALGGCGLDSFDIEKTPPAQALPVPENARPAPIGFNHIRYAVPTGTPLVAQRFLGCEPPYGIVQSGLSSRSFPNDDFRRVFLDTMEAQGYDVAGDPGRLFDEDEDGMRAMYGIGARVVDVKINACNRINLWGYNAGQSGEISITIEWTVFDFLHRKNIYKSSTKGYAKIKLPNQEALPLLLEQGFAAAAARLGADAQFHDLVFFGDIPEKIPDTRDDPYEDPVGVFDPAEKVTLEPLPVSSAVVEPPLDRLSRPIVLIQVAGGHGSGFFITKEGHIITNAHVVGGARQVRVVTSEKRKKLVAEILRVDRRRDVALLKVMEMPPDFNVPLLPVRTDKLGVGEEIYAVGAPAATKLQDTITKGIVSAHRFDRQTKLWEIQADVFIYGGNSGGPLVDSRGNIVGVTVSGWTDGPQALSGLNNFIPIGDALEKLGISH
ncbi:MAG: trypsin-like peptidase domain-containing protein [Alphaproteobacteria bacterium]|nr:trypsin-like peptidase domain-containing protein [Alphaproteobacteria bacterium]